MKQILILSGKGGTGKTNFASSFSILGREKIIAADCDVDASDMYLVLKPVFQEEEDFYSGYFAEINHTNCTLCGKCLQVCRFDAIKKAEGRIAIDEQSCEGCGYCSKVCMDNAITMKERKVGKIFKAKTEYGFDLIYAILEPGGENSGKLVSKVKKTAFQIAKDTEKDYIIIDGSPGIGCPVSASLAGVDYVVIVTEPSLSGFSDLKRLYQLIEKLQIKTGCIINKFDINENITNDIIQYLGINKIDYIDKFYFNKSFIQANRAGIPIILYADTDLKERISIAWAKIINYINERD